MSKWFLSILLSVFIFIWLLSGEMSQPEAEIAPSLEEQNERLASASRDIVTKVRAKVISASGQTGTVLVRGRTKANRVVDVRAETSGRVIKLPVNRGGTLSTGDVICELDKEDRDAKLEEATAKTRQADLEYAGALSLSADGLQSEANLAAAKAKLAAERANLNQRQLDLDRTKILAPFDGILDYIAVEIGDYLQPGGSCGRLVDLNPILVVGNVSERDIDQVKINTNAVATLLNDSTLNGVISFVSLNADDLSRTYELEMEVPNPKNTIPSGLTATISIPTQTYLAHKIPSSLLVLDDYGRIGVRVLSSNNRVVFETVELIKDTVDGVWVTGLSPITTLITVGHALVVHGDFVEVDLGDSLPETTKLNAEQPNKPSDIRDQQSEGT